MSIAEQITQLKSDFDDVYAKGIEEGQKAEYDKFWDNFQLGKNDYQYAFCGWNDGIFYPKYDFNISQNTFRQSKITDLKQRIEECGVNYKVKSLYLTFLDSTVTHVPDLSDYSSTNANTWLQTFQGCRDLHTVDGIRYQETSNIDAAYANCISLENITVYGVIGTNFDIHWSPITLESAKSIIGCLKDYSGSSNENAYTVSFSDTTWAYLDADENPALNGTALNVTWREYIASLGWLTN